MFKPDTTATRRRTKRGMADQDVEIGDSKAEATATAAADATPVDDTPKNNPRIAEAKDAAPSMIVFTLEELATHGTKESPYMAIDGGVCVPVCGRFHLHRSARGFHANKTSAQQVL